MEDGKNETFGTGLICLMFKVEICRKKFITKNDKILRQISPVPNVSKRRNDAKFKSNL